MFQKVESFLEHSDGSPKFNDAWLCCLPLKLAMKNVLHDDPEFWRELIEEFGS
jgi:hypothetical protein